ncbi:hypothetical protein N2152v2_008989 [Parachlorella kessleri]
MGDLEQMIQAYRESHSLVPEDAIWCTLVQLGAGLRTLHRMSIVHRDVKPQNALVATDGRMVLADFGIAKFMSNPLTSTLASHTGSPLYLAPEVLQQQAYSLECDVYSLGCLLYEMAALRPPFSGHDLKTLKINVLMGRLERIPSQHSDELWQIIYSMLNPDPCLRPDIHAIMCEPSVRQRQQLLPRFASAGTEVTAAGAAAAGPGVGLRSCVLDTIPEPEDLAQLNLLLPPATYPHGPSVLDYLLNEQLGAPEPTGYTTLSLWGSSPLQPASPTSATAAAAVMAAPTPAAAPATPLPRALGPAAAAASPAAALSKPVAANAFHLSAVASTVRPQRSSESALADNPSEAAAEALPVDSLQFASKPADIAETGMCASCGRHPADAALMAQFLDAASSLACAPDNAISAPWAGGVPTPEQLGKSGHSHSSSPIPSQPASPSCCLTQVDITSPRSHDQRSSDSTAQTVKSKLFVKGILGLLRGLRPSPAAVSHSVSLGTAGSAGGKPLDLSYLDSHARQDRPRKPGEAAACCVESSALAAQGPAAGASKTHRRRSLRGLFDRL